MEGKKELRLSRRKLVAFVGIMTGAALIAWVILMVGIFRKKDDPKPENGKTPTQTSEVPGGQNGVRVFKETAAYRVLEDGTRETIRITEYDQNGCPVKKTYYSDGPREAVSYYDEKRLIQFIEDRGLEDGTIGIINYSYDAAGHLTEKNRSNYDEDNGCYRQNDSGEESFRYDAEGHITDYYQSVDDIVYSARHFAYDSEGRLIRESVDKRADGMITERDTKYITYRSNGKYQKIQEIREERSDDGDGFTIIRETISYYNADGLETEYAVYDHGELTESMTWNGFIGEKIVYDSSGTVKERTVLVREADGHVLSSEARSSDGSFRSIRAYDLQGNLTMNTEYIHDEMRSHYEYEYDSRGNLCKVTSYDINGDVISCLEKTYSSKGEELSRKLITTYDTFVELECVTDENENIIRRTERFNLDTTRNFYDPNLDGVQITEYEYKAFYVPENLLSDEEKKSLGMETGKKQAVKCEKSGK